MSATCEFISPLAPNNQHIFYVDRVRKLKRREFESGITLGCRFFLLPAISEACCLRERERNRTGEHRPASEWETPRKHKTRGYPSPNRRLHMRKQLTLHPSSHNHQPQPQRVRPLLLTTPMTLCRLPPSRTPSRPA